jgi:hypothetical protein
MCASRTLPYVHVGFGVHCLISFHVIVMYISTFCIAYTCTALDQVSHFLHIPSQNLKRYRDWILMLEIFEYLKAQLIRLMVEYNLIIRFILEWVNFIWLADEMNSTGVGLGILPDKVNGE